MSPAYSFNPGRSPQEFLNNGVPDLAACLVTDLRMPAINGLNLQEELARAGCQIPVIFITGHGDFPTSVRAMKMGAIEFFTKPFLKQSSLKAIDEALRCDRAGRRQRAHVEELRQHFQLLTPRESEVMMHVVAGSLNKQIAAQLNIAEETIKFHCANIMRKMQPESLAALVRIAGDLDLLPPRSDLLQADRYV